MTTAETTINIRTEGGPPPPVRTPGESGHRAQVIAAIHDLADFYTTHPHIPTPITVTAGSNVGSREELEQLAAGLDEHTYGSSLPQFDHTVFVTYAPVHACVQLIVNLRGPDRAL